MKWWSAPEEMFRLLRPSPIIEAGKVKGFDRGRLLCAQQEWFLREICSMLFGSRDPKTSPPDFTRGIEDEEMCARCRCSPRMMSLIKRDSLGRTLIEVRLERQTWRYRPAFENWASAPLAPRMEPGKSSDSRILLSEGLELKAGREIQFAPFSVKALRCEDQNLQVSLAGAKLTMRSPIQTACAEEALTPASSRLEEQIEGLLGPFFHQAGGMLDRALRGRIARAVKDSGGTFEQYRDFVKARCRKLYPGPLFAALAETEFRDWLKKEALYGSNNGTGPKEVVQSDVLDAEDSIRTTLQLIADSTPASVNWEAWHNEIEACRANHPELLKKALSEMPGDLFEPFLVEATDCGLPASRVDWDNAKLIWLRLSQSDRMEAIEGLRARKASEYADPAFRPRPDRYLEKRVWERPVRSAPKTAHQSAIEETERWAREMDSQMRSSSS